MQFRKLGKTGWDISAIGLGTWAMGSEWGAVDDTESLATLNRALDLGVNFFDTADVYGSEHLLGALRRQRSEPFYVATKMGRSASPDGRGFTPDNIRYFADHSLRQLRVETIDLMQLHSLPIETYSAQTFGVLDDLVADGKIRNYGVSVERIVEAERAIEFPNVATVQIVFNIFRQRPASSFFAQAKRRGVGILSRVPLASGMLTGKMTAHTTFAADDHRSFNRHGESFDQGETFAGVDYDTGLAAVEELRALIPEGWTMAEMALRWILMFPEVSATIPGARHAAQAEDNIRAADLPPLSESTMTAIRDIYDRLIGPQVEDRW